MKIMATSFKRSHAGTAALSAPNPAAGHRQPTPPPETPGHSWASLGQSLEGSLFLSPGSWCAQGSVCALQESVSQVLRKFWQLYGGLMVTSSNQVLRKFWQLYGGLMATSSKRAYAIPRSAASRAPEAGHCSPIPPQFIIRKIQIITEMK